MWVADNLKGTLYGENQQPLRKCHHACVVCVDTATTSAASTPRGNLASRQLTRYFPLGVPAFEEFPLELLHLSVIMYYS